MFVLNPGHTDSRVRREAQALSAAGYRVTVFALATADHPAERIDDDGFTIVRLPARSILQRLRRRRLQRAAGPSGRPTSPPPPGSRYRPRRIARGVWRRLGPLRRAGRRLLRWALLPFHASSLRNDFRRLAVAAAAAIQPDVAHAHDLNTLAAATTLARRNRGVKVVYDSHELWRHRNRPGGNRRGRWREAWQERRLIRRADLVITVGDRIAAWLSSAYGTAAPTVVRNVPAFEPGGDTAGLRDLAGLDAGSRMIVYTGRITASRGLEATIDALRHLPDDVHLVMLGYGPETYLAGLSQAADAGGVAARLHRVGPVDSSQVVATMRDADVAAVMIEPTCLSYALSLPNKLFESIHARVPVITSDDLEEVRDIVDRYHIGESAAHTGPAVAAAVAKVLAAPDEYRRGLDAAAAEFTWDREAERLIAAYRDLIPVSR